MKEYLLLFRCEKPDSGIDPSLHMQEVMKHWRAWISGIATAGNYSGTNRLLPEGKIIRPGKLITDGPFMESKEMLGGYVLVKAASLDEATEIAKGCPVLTYGGNVEIRPVMPINYDPASTSFLDLVN